jgi:hypothetical protein
MATARSWQPASGRATGDFITVKSLADGDSHSGAATTTRGNSGKEGYWERKEAADIAKQPRIERQHAQEMALRFTP